MALGKNEPVPVFVFGVRGVYTQLPVIQVRKHFRRRQAAAGVPGLGAVGRGDDAHTDLAGLFL